MKKLLLLLYFFSAFATAAIPAPEPVVEGNTLVWEAVDAITINVHTGSGEYLESIPGDSTRWMSQYPGDYFLVSADHGDWRDWGRSVTLSVVTQSTAVNNLRGLVYGPFSLEIFWSPPADAPAGGYAVYRGDTLLATCSCSSLYENDVRPSTDYVYTVIPLDEDGGKAEASTVTLRTRSLSELEYPPVNLTATLYSSTAAELFWDQPDDPESLLSHYVVYRNDWPINSNRIGETTGNSFYDPGLTPCTQYVYQLELRDIYDREALPKPTVEVMTTGCDSITPPDNERTGIWQGTTSYGYTSIVIDEDSNAYGFSDDGAGRYRSILGNLKELYGEIGHQKLYEFYFTDSDDKNSLENTFRLSDDEPNPAIVPYAMGQDYPNLDNYSPDERFERFTLTIADENTVPLLVMAGLQGDWESRTVTCTDTSCFVYRVSITLNSDGTMIGRWTSGDVSSPDTLELVPIEGTFSVQGQFLATEFEESLETTTLHKNGVIYWMDNKLLFNAFGMQADGTADSIVTLLSRSP